MPELPEVETIARDLRGLVAGALIVGASSNWPPTLRSHEPEAFAAGVAGRPIEGVGRRGKQLLLWLGPANGATEETATEPAVLTVHLKMTGQLFVVASGTPSDRHVHVVLALADGRELRFRDMRKFGRMGLYRRDTVTGEPAKGEAVGVLATGAEPLSDDFTARRFAEMLSRRRGRLKTLLMNQDFVAGVGNIYADEALWRSRLHPLRDAHTLRPDEIRRLHRALRDVLAEAVERRGSSVDDYTAPEGDGSMQEHLQVYQRTGEACKRCSRPIRRIVVGGRSTHSARGASDFRPNRGRRRRRCCDRRTKLRPLRFAAVPAGPSSRARGHWAEPGTRKQRPPNGSAESPPIERPQRRGVLLRGAEPRPGRAGPPDVDREACRGRSRGRRFHDSLPRRRGRRRGR